jgi:hypothetical protein
MRRTAILVFEFGGMVGGILAENSRTPQRKGFALRRPDAEFRW